LAWIKIYAPKIGIYLYPGLPDGVFSNPNSYIFGSILEGLEMEDVGTFYCHFMVIWYIFLFWYLATLLKNPKREIGF
jgi:hypothetical protein